MNPGPLLQFRQRDDHALWEAFRRTGAQVSRDALVERYAAFARMLAAKAYGRRVIDEMEFDDYLQYAHVGLIESIGRYDPDQGAKFETFAASRINGAILNGLESATELQGQLAARKRLLAGRVEALHDNASEPDEEEDVFARLAATAIGLAVGFLLEDSGMYQGGQEVIGEGGYASVELAQLRDLVRAEVQLLKEQQRKVIGYHYLQQIPFEQIAGILGVSKGRVAQIHKEALGRLQEQLKAHRVLDASF
jgi:RNA polymerase sigma factor for flagellar operon FliA